MSSASRRKSTNTRTAGSSATPHGQTLSMRIRSSPKRLPQWPCATGTQPRTLTEGQSLPRRPSRTPCDRTRPIVIKPSRRTSATGSRRNNARRARRTPACTCKRARGRPQARTAQLA
eukprot:Amastigsp_a510135_16.p5 type:complete len:117 gc:universal Amastigsp_a510135_16:1195-1545(+)